MIVQPVRLLSVDGVATVVARGDLDHSSVWNLTQEVAHALADASTLRLVVDLGQTTFMSAAVLGTLVGALKRCRRRGIRLDVRCPDARMRRLFHITDLEEMLLDAGRAQAPG